MPTPTPCSPLFKSNAGGVLRCNGCGKNVHCTHDELNNYRHGDYWPRCCDEVMLFHGHPVEQIEGQPTVKP